MNMLLIIARRVSAFFILFFLVVSVIIPATGSALVSRVSENADGLGGDTNSTFGTTGGMSPDGRYIVFQSESSNLVPDKGLLSDFQIFWYDRDTGDLEMISVTPSGDPGNGDSGGPSVSGDGRFIAFQSRATDLMATADTNGPNEQDLFVYDRDTGIMEMVSLNNAGQQTDDSAFTPIITPDGRYVVFHSAANNLVSPDTLNTIYQEVYIYDRDMNTIERMSESTAGVQGEGTSISPSVSDDGNYVVFSSTSTNLIEDDVNLVTDIFLYDRINDTLERITELPDGTDANGPSQYPFISPDGGYVTFSSRASNLVTNDTNGSVSDIFLYDRVEDTFELISKSSSGGAANGTSSSLSSISADGRYVMFDSFASNLVENDTNSRGDAFIYDRQTSTTQRVTIDSVGNQADNFSNFGVISNNGEYIVFNSIATNLIPGDTNGRTDVFTAPLFVYVPTVVSQSTQNTTPTITGTWDSENAALVQVQVDDRMYFRNIFDDDASDEELTFDGDTWSLDLSDASPFDPGTYDVVVTNWHSLATDVDITLNELVILATDPLVGIPTVETLVTTEINPIITGTWDDENATTLTVTINGQTYTYIEGNSAGSDPALSVSGSTWELDLSGETSLAVGVTYDVVVSNSNDTNNNNDSTLNEVAVIATPTTSPNTSNNTAGGVSGGISAPGCPDPNATNYDPFGLPNQSICQYEVTTCFDEFEECEEATLTCPYFNGFHRLGSSGYEVAKIQHFLNAYINSQILVDGKFGPRTDRAVKNFQVLHAKDILDPWQLEGPTGWVYKTTNGNMNEIVGCQVEDRFLERVNIVNSFDNEKLFNSFTGELLGGVNVGERSSSATIRSSNQGLDSSNEEEDTVVENASQTPKDILEESETEPIPGSFEDALLQGEEVSQP